jgi:S-formylglutathione hydrolase
LTKVVSETRSFGGVQGVYEHASAATRTPMTFAAFVPEHEAGEKLPVLFYLSGLTCTHANVMEKGEYRAACAKHRIILVAPDTSPRGPDLDGNDVPDAADEYDLGQGAGFYVNATQGDWSQHYQMRNYIEDELPKVVEELLPAADLSRQAITGHSMGGHGALTIALRNPGRFASVSAFSPIVAPTRVPWGQKALSRYLGEDQAAWREYDAVALIEDGARVDHILVDQGTADKFLDEQLRTHLLAEACEHAGIYADIRMQEGYDHSYFFIATFMENHIAWHARHLAA